jgi:LysM repeat protein
VTRGQLARLGAPAAFLLGVTVAVLLVRAGIEGGATPARTGPLGPASRTTTVFTVPTGTATGTGARTATTGAARQYVTVRRGDTFGSIAASAGISVAAVEALNPGVSSNTLQVGQKIRVK